MSDKNKSIFPDDWTGGGAASAGKQVPVEVPAEFPLVSDERGYHGWPTVADVRGFAWRRRGRLGAGGGPCGPG